MSGENNSSALSESIDGVICFYEDSDYANIIHEVLKESLPNVPIYSYSRGLDALNLYKKEASKGSRLLVFTDLNKGKYFSGEVLSERIRMHESMRGGGTSVIIALSPKDDSYLRKARQYEFNRIMGFSELFDEKKLKNMLLEETSKFRN